MKALRLHAYRQAPTLDEYGTDGDRTARRHRAVGSAGLCRTDVHICDGWFAPAVPNRHTADPRPRDLCGVAIEVVDQVHDLLLWHEPYDPMLSPGGRPSGLSGVSDRTPSVSVTVVCGPSATRPCRRFVGRQPDPRAGR